MAGLLQNSGDTIKYIYDLGKQSLGKFAKNSGKSILNIFNDDPKTVTLLLASTEAIVRPLITLSNKKEDKEKRNFAALTEFVLQLVVIPVVLTIPTLFKATAKFFNPGGIPKGKELPKNVKNIAGFLSFLGLFAGNFIIPPITTKVVNALEKNRKNSKSPEVHKEQVIRVNEFLNDNKLQKPVSFKSSRTRPSNGMRIGG